MLRSHHRAGECLGQALLSRCHGVKEKLIQLLGWERSRGSARGDESLQDLPQACTCVWLNLRAVTMK